MQQPSFSGLFPEAVNTRISCVIPTFKEGVYITDSLRYLGEQTLFQNIDEIILAEYDPDGTKETEKSIRQNLGNSPAITRKIKVVYVDKRGIGYARGVGTSQTTAPYIVNLDADSHFHRPNGMEQLLTLLLKNEADIVFPANVLDTYETTDTFSHTLYFGRNELMKTVPLAYEPGLMYSRKIYDEIGGWRDVPLAEAPLLAVDAMIHLKRVKYVPEVAVVVSARRLKSKDFNYFNAYRNGQKFEIK